MGFVSPLTGLLLWYSLSLHILDWGWGWVGSGANTTTHNRTKAATKSGTCPAAVEYCFGHSLRHGEEACFSLGFAKPIHSSRIDRGGGPPQKSLMRCFTGLNHLVGAFEPSYPEGNFEGNQLLGGSIGLSPLCRTQATQFARQNSDRPPPQFPTASSWNGIVRHLSGPMDLASTQNPVHWTSEPVSHAARSLPFASPSLVSLSLSLRNSNPIIWESCLHYALLALGFRSTSQQASCIDSLVRVSRRAESGTDTAKLKLPTCTLHHLGSPGSHRATSTNQCSHRCLPRAPRPYTTGQ